MALEGNKTPLNRLLEGIKNFFSRNVEVGPAPQYVKEYFDLLYSEYSALPHDSIPPSVSQRVHGIVQKRKSGELRWSDVYGFDLLLVELLPVRDLLKKAHDMRAKYRSVAGQRDYDAYIASRPPDLTLLPDKDQTGAQGDAARLITSPPGGAAWSFRRWSVQDDAARFITSPPVITSPPALPVDWDAPSQIESWRADIRYLLGQFYLYYTLLPYREEYRDEITRRARNLTYVFLLAFGLVVILTSAEARLPFRVPTLLVVILTGIIGGCVSMLQRIQSAPSEGDALFNLAALTSGWKGMSLSPLYGAIFAMLFYMLFAGGIVKGVVFPEIKSPQSLASDSLIEKPNATPNANASPAATPTPENETRPPSTFWRFTDGTYPISGKDYALLIIWSFLAGFLERLVPDALNRLVTKNQLIEGTSN